jgi:hypothetical protein
MLKAMMILSVFDVEDTLHLTMVMPEQSVIVNVFRRFRVGVGATNPLVLIRVILQVQKS